MSIRSSYRALGLFLLLLGNNAVAAPTREQVEAALVYKFAQFIQWNSGARAPDSPVVVGILGNDAIRPALEEILLEKRLGGRRFEVRVFGRPEEVRDCEILIVDILDSRRARVLQSLPKKGLLTIGEGALFARQGGVIAVIMDETRVKFDLNLAAAEEAGLTFNATLLGLAREAGRW